MQKNKDEVIVTHDGITRIFGNVQSALDFAEEKINMAKSARIKASELLSEAEGNMGAANAVLDKVTQK